MTDEELPVSLMYRFSYFDPMRKRWLTARYRATLEVIRARYAEFRLEGEPEIRGGKPSGFMPPGR